MNAFFWRSFFWATWRNLIKNWACKRNFKMRRLMKSSKIKRVDRSLLILDCTSVSASYDIERWLEIAQRLSLNSRSLSRREKKKEWEWWAKIESFAIWKKRKKSKFDDVIVVWRSRSRMTRTLNRCFAFERTRRRRWRLYTWLISKNMKTNRLRIVSKITSLFFRVIMTICTQLFEEFWHYNASTKNSRFRFARDAFKFRQLISRESQRRFFIDETI
jgi:hypothetical protein